MMIIPTLQEEVSGHHFTFIHGMCLTNVLLIEGTNPNTICYNWEETHSYRGTNMGNLGQKQLLIALHYCLLCSHKLTLNKITLSVCQLTNPKLNQKNRQSR